ncbi:MAG: tetratricopeptide repeat protein [Anaerolineaceae bacterium]|nr:tetratricopeptide repeat protein [Anaerolineaceae bacterium]
MKKQILFTFIILSLLLASCNPTASPQVAAGTTQTNGQEAATPTITATATPTPEILVSQGEEAMRNGDYDLAMTEFTQALNSPDTEIAAQANLGIGLIYYYKENYNQALQKLGWLVNTFSSSNSRIKGFFYLAKTYEALEEYAHAAEAYKNYLSLTPGSPLQGDILELQADDLYAAGNTADALAVYSQALPLARPESKEELQLKVAKAIEANGDDSSAIEQYLAVYTNSSNGYIKAAANLALGQIYLKLGEPDQAYSRFQDSVAQFPTAYDSYSGMVALIDANQPVDDMLRGIVDYYAGQYGVAISAFDRYMAATPDHTDTAHYYKALSYWQMGDYEKEVAEWDTLIKDHPKGEHYAQAFLEKSQTQWYYLNEFANAAQTLLQYALVDPTGPQAANYIFRAARIYEQNNQLERAAQTWERIINEYPADEDAILAQFEAGICYYRLQQYDKALVTFMKNSLLVSANADKARAELWIGKTYEKLGKADEAAAAYQLAVSADPTGYYSIRAAEIVNKQSPFPASNSIDLGINWENEKKTAIQWMKLKFSLADDVDLNGPGDLANNVLYQRGDAFWELGLTSKAQSEFESLRQQLNNDAANSFRLMAHMRELGLNQTAVLCARQILDLIGMGQATFLSDTPAYFNHIRFGINYRELIVPTAVENNIDPLLLFSVIRQESLFEADIVSSQGASGLMQIIPSVGTEISTEMNWPSDYIDQDLTRPYVNVKMGTHYLAKWMNYFEGDLTAALAAYNGGIGNSMAWRELSGDDPDLFLEVIRYDETRDYIRYITENFEIYKTIYTHP